MQAFQDRDRGIDDRVWDQVAPVDDGVIAGADPAEQVFAKLRATPPPSPTSVPMGASSTGQIAHRKRGRGPIGTHAAVLAQGNASWAAASSDAGTRVFKPRCELDRMLCARGP